MKGLIVGIANDKSIAWGAAKAFKEAGHDLAITYLNDKALRFVKPLADEVNADIFMPMDITVPGELESVYDAITQKWGKLDFVLHSIAFAPMNDLHGRVIDSSGDGFMKAMDVSCHSFVKMAKLSEPLMVDGGTLLTVTYYGSEKVVPHYGIMGPVKAALESTTRYLAAELGEKKIRVHAISPGPIATRAASGIDHFDDLMAEAIHRSPEHVLTNIDEVGKLANFLVSDNATTMTGNVIHIDGGYHIMG